MAGIIFSKFDQQDLNRIAAKGILEKIRTVRQGIDKDFTSRRLLWELIQNAKDNASICQRDGTAKVDIEINLTKDKLTFLHNNGFFSNENIRGIIRRYSSSEKDSAERENEKKVKTTGRFGTGFMTTHILSEKVLIKGLYQDESCFKAFSLPIDRTGRNTDEIIKSIENSFGEVEKSILESIDYNENNIFKSEFIYELNSDTLKIAKMAIEEVKQTLGVVLVNIPSINIIKIVEGGNTLEYFVKESLVQNINNIKLRFFDLHCNNNYLNSYASFANENSNIIIPITIKDDLRFVNELENNIPRLFLDFPLIGTEIINLPFIINSHSFEPTESRNGVSLTTSNDNDTLQNKNIILNALQLYYQYLDLLSVQNKWGNLYNAARVKNQSQNNWIDKNWFNNNIIIPLQKKITNTPLVETVNQGRFPFSKGKATVDFPFDKVKGNCEKIWNICNTEGYFILPIKDHIFYWNEILWTEEFNLTFNTIAEVIENHDSLKKIGETLVLNEERTIMWLNDFYDSIPQIGAFTKRKIFLDQNNNFQLLDNLSIDNNLDEELKEIAEKFKIEISSKLLNKGIFADLKINRNIDNESLSQEIEKEVKKIWKNDELRDANKVSMMDLFLWIRKNESLSQKLFNTVYEKQFLLIDDDDLSNRVKKSEDLDNLLDDTSLSLEEIRTKLIKSTEEETISVEEQNEIEFAKHFEELDKDVIEKQIDENAEYFTTDEDKTFKEKLLELIDNSNSMWKGYAYHFTHIENAVKIIMGKKILSRNKADFINSAGNAYINNTHDVIKDFARFYFRPHTPTQYYNEGLGSVTKTGDLPQCPVPIFFRFSIKEILENNKNNCFVSNGNLRHYPNVQFDNSYEFLKKMNFKNMYSLFGSCDLGKYMNASQQELIVKDQLDFSEMIDFDIICRTKADYVTLVILLGVNHELVKKIKVDNSYYDGINPTVDVSLSNNCLKVDFSARYESEEVEIESIKNINNNVIADNIIASKSLKICSKSNDVKYNIFYHNNNQKWLIFTNGNSTN